MVNGPHLYRVVIPKALHGASHSPTASGWRPAPQSWPDLLHRLGCRHPSIHINRMICYKKKKHFLLGESHKIDSVFSSTGVLFLSGCLCPTSSSPSLPAFVCQVARVPLSLAHLCHSPVSSSAPLLLDPSRILHWQKMPPLSSERRESPAGFILSESCKQFCSSLWWSFVLQREVFGRKRISSALH